MTGAASAATATAGVLSVSDVINLVSAGVSLILSLFAIWLSLWFYRLSKDTEKNVTETLAKITTQGDMLQKLTGRWMDRLTRYATDSHPTTETVATLITLIRGDTTVSTAGAAIKTEDNTEELVACYIGIFYYAVITNMGFQDLVPPAELFDPENAGHKGLARVVDTSAADVIFMEDVLEGVAPKLIAASRLAHLHRHATGLRGSVKTTTDLFAERARSS